MIGTPDQTIQELHDRVGEGISYFIVVATSPETQQSLADEVLPALSQDSPQQASIRLGGS